jgi:hypothetical protein
VTVEVAIVIDGTQTTRRCQDCGWNETFWQGALKSK